MLSISFCWSIAKVRAVDSASAWAVEIAAVRLALAWIRTNTMAGDIVSRTRIPTRQESDLIFKAKVERMHIFKKPRKLCLAFQKKQPKTNPT